MISLYKFVQLSVQQHAIGLLALVFGLGAAPLAGAQECQPLQSNPASLRTDVRHEHGLLWRISKPGFDDSYLFGTIHVSDPAITDVPAPVNRALEDVGQFVMEAKLDGTMMLDFAQQMFYGDGRRLDELLDPKLYRRAEKLLAGYGMPPLAVQSLKPWAAYMTLNMPPDTGLPLDLVLMNKAQRLGLPVTGLETMAEQLDVFQQLSEAVQLDLLVDTLCHYDTLQQDMEQMKALYLQRDLQGLFRYHNKYSIQDHDMYRQLLQRLLWDRNHLMAERMQLLLAENSTFVAIGAMHLPGEQGVLSLLEQAGFTVKPVY